MHQKVHPAEGLPEVGDRPFDLGVVCRVHLADPWIRDSQGADTPLGPPEVLLAGQAGERAAGTLCQQRLGDEPGVGTLVGDADDQTDLSVQNAHGEGSSCSGSPSVRASTIVG